ncbi:Endonuclease/exonuclease/phosphatase [Dillenia turbinata]|uniref:Endonuclease/exonuclease/phosphatase n=1 Tax=Dillenia turbinata TaxID=194707 RepID=A0AAN8W362_9MAGN
MLKILNKKFRHLCSGLKWPGRRHSTKPKIVIKTLGKSSSKLQSDQIQDLKPNGSAAVHPNHQKPIRIATFNAALFSMAPAVPKTEKSQASVDENDQVVKATNHKLRAKSMNDRPKSILKQSPLHPKSMNSQKFAKSRLRVSINLPDNEISLKRNQSSLSFCEDENITRNLRGKAPLFSSTSFSSNGVVESHSSRNERTIAEVLRELDADILGLQDVKAEEEKGMKPLSDLASALGMNYVFAESWAPEYGNAILSKWPIKRWRIQKIFDDTDFRNVLKATIDVPHTGEVNFHCTHLDHLDENWRLKQINTIIHSNTEPHILAGGLNSLDETDYSAERWTDIVKFLSILCDQYYEEMGKPTPKVEVMKLLKGIQYTDAKDFAGECEAVVMIAKGQSVQGTCKYGTRVDYILASPDSTYKFVPGSYSVLSSKGTSDHHIVKVDIVKVDSNAQEKVTQRRRQRKQKVVKITDSSPVKGIWKTTT